jgi:hypothetical protein
MLESVEVEELGGEFDISTYARNILLSGKATSSQMQTQGG